MEVEQKDGSDDSLNNGNGNPAKRGRGRPRGSVKKTIISVTEVMQKARTSKRVDFFSPDTIRQKAKKRGRPKKIRMPGRPRKIPLTPEEEAERMLRLAKQKNRKISKPLGRPRIHPIGDSPKKRGRGRPPKYETLSRTYSQNGAVNFVSSGKRGRPRGSFKKKLSPAVGSSLVKRSVEGIPRKRGRPPGSTKQGSTGATRKRGRPPGSGTKLKVLSLGADGTPRKRGRPPGSGMKITFVTRETGAIARKRGRPPGPGTKSKVPLREADGTPRKRGRPPGSKKTKTGKKQTKGHDLSSSKAFSPGSQPRKRGRPSKASLVQNEVNDAPLSKRARNSFEYSSEDAETDANKQNFSENNAALTASSDLLAEDDCEGRRHVEEFQEVVVMGNESNSRKSCSQRGVGKSPKKK